MDSMWHQAKTDAEITGSKDKKQNRSPITRSRSPWQRKAFSSSSSSKAACSALWTDHAADGTGKAEVFSMPPDDDYVTILRAASHPPLPPPSSASPVRSSLF